MPARASKFSYFYAKILKLLALSAGFSLEDCSCFEVRNFSMKNHEEN